MTPSDRSPRRLSLAVVDVEGLDWSALDTTLVRVKSSASSRVVRRAPDRSPPPDFELVETRVRRVAGPGIAGVVRGELIAVRDVHDEIELGWKSETVAIPPRGTVAIAGEAGLVVMSSTGSPGEARVVYDESDVDVLLCVDVGVRLRNGDMVGAGQCWFRYVCVDDVKSPRIQLLDSRGVPQTSVLVRGGAISIGRELGDLILPAADLAAVHFRIECHDTGAVLINLAGPFRTWMAVRSGEVVPIDGVLAIGDRVVTLRPSGSHEREVGRPEAPAQRRGSSPAPVRA